MAENPEEQKHTSPSPEHHDPEEQKHQHCHSPEHRGSEEHNQTSHSPEQEQNQTSHSPEHLKHAHGMIDTEKHPGGCAAHRYGHKHRRRAFCAFLFVFLALAGITALIVWLVYRPHKPGFTVVAAAVYGINTSSPPFISATIQFTVVARNPNHRVSILYDHLSTFVSYRNQAITPPVMLPPFFHERESTVAISPVIGGAAVPASVEVANGLAMDEGYGVVGLRLVLMGKLRWKAGGIWTGHSGLYVRCELLVGLKKGFVGQVPLLGSPHSPCNVHIG
ncbi:hypothetical protein RJ639_043951 [Escallonia herrerae]|uniref:Late embryogenesis abundant protein LEA-2 subgroup domain-containing protein n=1 Tax=Escallonia herrerae TaxID=1293975 RepID=A0AA88WFP9_9ASTE|nr:hypothetical protein RJ639_043951 [Escallonia herrerae]